VTGSAIDIRRHVGILKLIFTEVPLAGRRPPRHHAADPRGCRRAAQLRRPTGGRRFITRRPHGRPGLIVCLRDTDYPADPYPGGVPECSFVHLDEASYPLRPDPSALAAWRVGAVDLDDWLAERSAAPMASRLPVLAYGSNRCPSKITWLRDQLGLAGPVVVLRTVTRGVAAVWTTGVRERDGQRPAVLAAAPGVTEHHSVWLATADQVSVLDRCEERGKRYRLARPRIQARTEDGALIERPWCYMALCEHRRPLLVDGAPVRCADLAQHEALLLSGTPATTDGLDAEDVSGEPHPDQWPAALFGYGLLQPGRSGWPMVAPYVAGPPRPASAFGTVYDTGLGWPAMMLGTEPAVPGTLVPLCDPASLLPTLDRYEGPDYQRVRLVLAENGAVAWAYAWVGATAGLRPFAPAK